MSQPVPPAVLRRQLNRSLWLAPVLAALALLIFWTTSRDQRAWNRALDAGSRVEAHVEGSYDGGPAIPVTYEHPVVGPAHAVLSDENRAAVRAAAGSIVAIDVSSTDPRDVAMAGVRRPRPEVLPFLLVPAGIVLVPWAVRHGDYWRTRRVMRRKGPSFALTGVVSVRSPQVLRWQRRVELHLFPLDAGAGAGSPALCSVPLHSNQGLPLGVRIPVEVKGAPRSFARVVARHDGEVLWPKGRALAGSTPVSGASRDRSTERLSPLGIAAVPLAPELDLLGLLAAARLWVLGGLSALSVVAGVTLVNWHRAEEVFGQGQRVVATIESTRQPPGAGTKHGPHLALRVSYRSSEDAPMFTGRVLVEYPEEWREGDRFPAVIDPDDGKLLRFLASPYDPVAPIVWGCLPLLLAWWVAVRRIRLRRWVRAAILVGPWYQVEIWSVRRKRSRPYRRLRPWLIGATTPAEAWRDLQRDLVAVAAPGASVPLCVIPYVPRAELGHLDGGRREARPALVAGLPAAGEVVVVHIGGRTLMPAGPAKLPSGRPEERRPKPGRNRSRQRDKAIKQTPKQASGWAALALGVTAVLYRQRRQRR